MADPPADPPVCDKCKGDRIYWNGQKLVRCPKCK